MAQFFHHNDFGYCVRCPRTRYLHLCFGNVALAATTAEFQRFRVAMAAAQHAHRAACHDPEARCIALPTAADKLALVLTWQELAQLRDILENTALLLEVEALLDVER